MSSEESWRNSIFRFCMGNNFVEKFAKSCGFQNFCPGFGREWCQKTRLVWGSADIQQPMLYAWEFREFFGKSGNFSENCQNFSGPAPDLPEIHNGGADRVPAPLFVLIWTGVDTKIWKKG